MVTFLQVSLLYVRHHSKSGTSKSNGAKEIFSYLTINLIITLTIRGELSEWNGVYGILTGVSVHI